MNAKRPRCSIDQLPEVIGPAAYAATAALATCRLDPETTVVHLRNAKAAVTKALAAAERVVSGSRSAGR